MRITLLLILGLTACAAETGPEVEADTEALQLHAFQRADEAAQCYLRATKDATADCTFLQDGGLAGNCLVNFFGYAWWSYYSFETSPGRWHETLSIGSTVVADISYCTSNCGLASNLYQYDLFVHGATAACVVTGTWPNRVGTYNQQ